MALGAKKKNVTTCCVYAMYTSALVNGCERFIQYSKLYVCVESMWKDVCTVCVFVWERVWSVEGCGHMSNCEWTLCNGKCRWCDVKGSCSFPADHLNSNEVNTGHRLWRSTLLYNLPPATQKEKTLKKKKSLPILPWAETHRKRKKQRKIGGLTYASVWQRSEAALWRLPS